MISFEEKKQEHLDFWSGKRKNLISVMGGDWYGVPYKTLEEKWFAPHYRVEQMELYLKDQWYGKDCVPNSFVNYGPGILSACMGGSFKLLPYTIWFDESPIIEDYSNCPVIRFNENSDIYNNIVESTNLLLKNGENRYVVSVTDWGGIMDVLAGLRGTLELLTDLYDYPQEVLLLLEKIYEAWLTVKKKDEKIFQKQGFTHWIPIFANKSYQTIQCDFSAMISSEMFEKFAMPTLRKQVKQLDYSIYHLDGQEAEKHLDLLLTLDELDGIQYVPSDFNYQNSGDTHHFPLYEKILQGGKILALTGVSSDKMVPLLEHFGSERLFVSCTCFTTEEAKKLDEIMDKYRK
jgi:hypothetical protein